MTLISTRLAVICLTLPMTAALSAQSIADAARKAQEQREKAKATPANTYTDQSLPNDPAAPKTTPVPADQFGKQFITLFDVRGVGNSGGVKPIVIITGRGYVGTLDDRRRSGMKSEPGEDEFVSVDVADAKDPKLPHCMKLLIADVFMEHVVQIGGVGRIEPRSPRLPHLPPTLELNTLSECTAAPSLDRNETRHPRRSGDAPCLVVHERRELWRVLGQGHRRSRARRHVEKGRPAW